MAEGDDWEFISDSDETVSDCIQPNHKDVNPVSTETAVLVPPDLLAESSTDIACEELWLPCPSGNVENSCVVCPAGRLANDTLLVDVDNQDLMKEVAASCQTTMNDYKAAISLLHLRYDSPEPCRTSLDKSTSTESTRVQSVTPTRINVSYRRTPRNAHHTKPVREPPIKTGNEQPMILVNRPITRLYAKQITHLTVCVNRPMTRQYKKQLGL